MVTKEPNQLKMLAKHLSRARASISPAEASKVYGIDRLAARIFELKAVATCHPEAETRYDECGKRFTRYRATSCPSCRAILRAFATT